MTSIAAADRDTAPVEVIFCADAGYCGHTAAAIASLAASSPHTRVRATLFTCDTAPEAEAKLRATAERFANLEFLVHRVDGSVLDGLFVDGHLTRETYLRIVAADILSRTADRAIYLDSDLVVQDDIGLLWAADLGGKTIGAVEDLDLDGNGARRAAYLGPLPFYVNAGVLVIDLVRWRQFGISDRVLAYAAAQGDALAYHDQDALNAVLAGDVALLDARWNLPALAYSRKVRLERPDFHQTTRAARRDPGIVHYTSSAKPWNLAESCRRKGLYHHYARMTAWRDDRPAFASGAERLVHEVSLGLLRVGIDLGWARHAFRRATDRLRRPARRAHVEEPEARDGVDVLFCADEGYFQHLAAAAVSVASSTAPGTRLRFHVMTRHAPGPEAARLVETLRPFPDTTLVFHRVDDARVAGAFVDRYMTQDAYLRFLAPEVLPPEIERVVYLDCDLIVLGDVTELAATDLRGKAVGAVPEYPWTGVETERRLAGLGIAPGHRYVNSGVLVMDLARWRRDGLSTRLLRYVSEKNALLRYYDQDALNAVLQGDIAPLHPRWNLQPLMLGRWARKDNPGQYRRSRAARRIAGVVHFTTDRKPWKHRVSVPDRRLYFRFLSRTAWADVVPPLATRVQRIEYALARRLLAVGIDVYRLGASLDAAAAAAARLIPAPADRTRRQTQ